MQQFCCLGCYKSEASATVVQEEGAAEEEDADDEFDMEDDDYYQGENYGAPTVRQHGAGRRNHQYVHHNCFSCMSQCTVMSQSRLQLVCADDDEEYGELEDAGGDDEPYF